MLVLGSTRLFVKRGGFLEGEKILRKNSKKENIKIRRPSDSNVELRYLARRTTAFKYQRSREESINRFEPFVSPVHNIRVLNAMYGSYIETVYVTFPCRSFVISMFDEKLIVTVRRIN